MIADVSPEYLLSTAIAPPPVPLNKSLRLLCTPTLIVSPSPAYSMPLITLPICEGDSTKIVSSASSNTVQMPITTPRCYTTTKCVQSQTSATLQNRSYVTLILSSGFIVWNCCRPTTIPQPRCRDPKPRPGIAAIQLIPRYWDSRKLGTESCDCGSEE